MRVLVVEDNDAVRQGVVDGLTTSGFAVDQAVDLDEAEFKLDISDYDCVVFDRMLPSGDSIALLRKRREAGWHVPTLFLTARDSIDDRVAGFASGGDDYLVKPFALAELVARVTSLCRRAAVVRPSILTVGDLEIDTARQDVRRKAVLLSLTSKEFRILELLVVRAGTVVSRSEVIESCWDEMASPMSNVIDVNIVRLRAKLGDPPLIHTVRGVGFLIEPDGAAPG